MSPCAKLCHTGLLAAILVAVAACGGAVDGGAGPALGGQSGLGGGASQGGAAQGGTMSGSGGSTGCSTTTSAGIPIMSCWSGMDCPVYEYCDMQSCGGTSCSCINGAWLCSNLCTHTCEPYSSNCTQASSAFTDQLNSTSCTIMVRIDAAATQIAGYAVNCGLPKTNTQEDALNQLLPMSSINWFGATAFGDATNTGLYAFAVSFAQSEYTAYFSTDTGNLLLIAESPVSAGQGSYRLNTTWRAASELGTTCATGESMSAFSFGTSDTNVDYSAAQVLLEKTGLYRALRTKLGSVTSVAVTYVNTTPGEYLFFVTAG